MKLITVEVKTKDKVSGEKKTIGTIEVPTFANYGEIVEFYEKEKPGKGEATFLETFNDFIKNRMIADERVKKLRGPNVLKELKKAAQVSEEAKAEVNALLAKLGISGSL